MQDEELSIQSKVWLNKLNVIAGALMLICSVALFLIAIFKIDSTSHPYIYYTYQSFFYLGIAMMVFSILQLFNAI